MAAPAAAVIPETTATQNPKQALIDALLEKKGELSIRAMARKLSVSHTHLDRQLEGERPFGIELLKAVSRTFPDLRPLVHEYIDTPDTDTEEEGGEEREANPD
jgi:lambda repressor-like predicted transcriptional regulator